MYAITHTIRSVIRAQSKGLRVMGRLSDGLGLKVQSFLRQEFRVQMDRVHLWEHPAPRELHRPPLLSPLLIPTGLMAGRKLWIRPPSSAAPYTLCSQIIPQVSPIAASIAKDHLKQLPQSWS